MHLYIHIPFCSKACHYCDFHFSTSLKLKSELVEAICKEIELSSEYLTSKSLETIYFGGGTPSLLSVNELSKIFEAVNRFYHIKPDCEISFEANPDDINPEYVKLWKNIGINRLSIGIQTFDEQQLKFLNRSHNSKQAIDSVKIAQDIGIHDISIDLIYAIPSDSNNIWLENLEKSINLKTPHISSYCLTIEEKTVFGNWLSKNKILPIEDEYASIQFEILVKTLSENNFEQYEISNFAQNGRYSKHNTSYWKGEEYLGLGPSAHSYNKDSRQYNISNNSKYIQLIRNNKIYFEKENLSQKQKFNDYILTRLRTKWGVDLNELNKIAEGIPREIEKEINTHLKKGNIEFLDVNSIIILSKQGKLFADKIASDLFWV